MLSFFCEIHLQPVEVGVFFHTLDKNFQLIADFVEGDDRSVELPVNVKNEMLNDNVLATFHNHFNGAILPSSNDLKNTIIPCQIHGYNVQ